MKDVYDLEVERLTENPELIIESWKNAKPLFGFCTSSRHSFEWEPAAKECGCLTMVCNESGEAATDELTKLILADERLPISPSHITAENLPVFAEWQRKMDKLLNRKPPEVQQ